MGPPLFFVLAVLSVFGGCCQEERRTGVSFGFFRWKKVGAATLEIEEILAAAFFRGFWGLHSTTLSY